MRILFITNFFYPYIGGIEVNSEILANGFHREGHEVKLITWTAEIGDSKFDYPVIRQPNLSTLVKAHKWADVVYENNPCLKLSWPAFIFGKTSVVALRTWVSRLDGTSGWQDKLKLLWLKRAAKVIAVSKVIRDECWPEAIVIGNPYREKIFRVIPECSRTKDFVFLGRLVSDKGADLAIKALRDLNAWGSSGKFSQSEFSLTIIGDGDELTSLKELVNELGLAHSVVFAGALRGEEMVKLLNEHKYLLVPSMWKEPFGNVALEGMACGCLPIVADGGGLPDAVGDAGVVFERGNLDALVLAIKKLLNDPDRESLIRSNAASHLEQHHPDVIIKRYLSVIESTTENL
ncbi:glycosyltransferase family 4 protein [Pedobacter sp. MC2016-14]|uniref:glycosyltransferase family 4 protein n=1 Tax=Pedobacter sp. MC2016-14 TaxID=2897327 RepID=UPI001E5A6617|nr:glycosyltransferase family 4 protein [Pedobacter sp. MC2016-14]MCD0486862.1 glycosyltransferase family 4 protein [Pedobacter sp. MC2016-14]